MDAPTAHLLYLLRAGALPAPLSSAAWQVVLQAAAAHALLPLLYHRLRAADARAAVPPDVWAAMRDAYLSNAARNTRLYHELGRVLRALRDAGIPIIALKGAHLAALVYERIGARPMCDVDLLAPGGHLARAERVLLELGYAALGDNARFAEESFHTAYSLPHKGLTLELHHHLEFPLSPFCIDLAGLWARARPAEIAGAPTLVLAPEDLLLHLCLHASAHHAYTMGLRPLCDIAETIRHYGAEMDWPALAARASDWRASRCAYLTFHLARKWLDAAIPESACSALAPADLDPRTVAWAESRLFSPGTETFRGLGEMWAVSGYAGKLAFLCKAAFPSRQRMSQLYGVLPGSPRLYLCYPRRLAELLWRRLVALWQRWRRDPNMLAQAAREAETRALVQWLLE